MISKIAILLAAVLLLPLVPPPASAAPPNLICAHKTVEAGDFTIEITYNVPGPPGPATCIVSVKICNDEGCTTVP